MNNSYIKIDNLCIDFTVYMGSSQSFKSAFLRRATGGRIAGNNGGGVITVNALQDVSLDLKKGDKVGLYGHNGSGKTTLLRTIAGIYAPSKGSVDVKGKVASFLDITMGMDSEATGFENIYMRTAIMGYQKNEIDKIVDKIAEFSELGDYLQLPIRTYSAGMNMRLAFSISSAVESDILLMDEWLSVGDQDFKNKCDERLKDKISKTSIFMIASQELEMLKSICNRIVYLEAGSITKMEYVTG